MNRTNRIEPINIDPRYVGHAVLITTTRLEIIKQVEITPITEAVPDRRRSEINRSPPPASFKPSRKLFWCIGCLFFLAGLLAFSIVIVGFTIIFQRMKVLKTSNIERYNLGDLQYGISNINLPSNTYLSHMNKASIHNYLSEQLRSIPGYRGLIIDDILVQDKSSTNQRTARDLSCSILFIIQNIQVYFDHCSTCINQRNVLLRRLFFNRTTFKEPFYLLLNNRYFFAQICSIPNISQSSNDHSSFFISPQRLDLSDLNKITTHHKSRSYVDASTMNTIEITSIATSERPIHFTTDYPSTSARISTEEISSTSLSDDHIQTSTESSTTSRKPPGALFEFLPHRPSTTQVRTPRRVIVKH